jgi:formylglycine-generating enzyme required for sulfatase activity
MEMIAIPEGWFWMGSSGAGAGQDSERPRHRVWVDTFRLARTQVTNAEYAEFMAATGRPPSKHWGQPEFSHPRQPVVAVSWDDAMAYCNWLGAGFRLPTEAEWERAARAGIEDCEFPWGNDPPQSRPDYATRWLTGPEPVGTSPENAFGLDAMSENVHEWCLDSYDPAFYARAPERNPCCQDATGRRASRGGSWRHQIKIARCAARSSIPPQFAYADYGLRVAYSTICLA